MTRGKKTFPALAAICAVAFAASVSACTTSAPARVSGTVQVSLSSVRVPWSELASPDAIVADGPRVWIANNEDASSFNSSSDEGMNSVTEINAATGAVIRVISASRYQLTGPSAIATAGNTVWVANDNESASNVNSVTEINASTGALIRVISGGGYELSGPVGIATAGNTVWVADDNESASSCGGSACSVTEINASTGALIRVITASRYQLSGPVGITASADAVWVANSGIVNSVTEINAATGALIRVISGGSYQLSGPVGIATAGNTVWVANDNGDGNGCGAGACSVTEINASTGALMRVASSSALAPYAYAVTADAPGAWLVTNDVGGKWSSPGADISEFSAATGALVRTISEPPLLRSSNGTLAVAAAGAYLWVGGSDSSDEAGWVAEFSATTGALVREILAGAPPGSRDST